MSQTVSSSFAAQNAVGAKKLDYAFVIAGWPTVYTVSLNSYALAGDLASFSTINAWADIPACAGAMVKGRPEEGGLSIGQMDVTVLDRRSSGLRQLSDLLCREAYLEGTSLGVSTSLTADVGNSATASIPATSTSGFPSTGNLYIGQECIRYVGTDATHFGTTSVTRGYLLTSATPHRSGVLCYSFMPSVYRRRAFLYKGYQNLTLDKWARAFGGVIVGTQKAGPVVTFSVVSTTWEYYTDGKQVILGGSKNSSDPPIFGSIGLTSSDVLGGDFSLGVNATFSTTNLNNGHHLVNVGGYWKAIIS